MPASGRSRILATARVTASCGEQVSRHLLEFAAVQPDGVVADMQHAGLGALALVMAAP